MLFLNLDFAIFFQAFWIVAFLGCWQMCCHFPAEETICICSPYGFPTDTFLLPLVFVIKNYRAFAFRACNHKSRICSSGHSLCLFNSSICSCTDPVSLITYRFRHLGQIIPDFPSDVIKALQFRNSPGSENLKPQLHFIYILLHNKPITHNLLQIPESRIIIYL